MGFYFLQLFYTNFDLLEIKKFTSYIKYKTIKDVLTYLINLTK